MEDLTGLRLSHTLNVPSVEPVYNKLLSILLYLQPISLSACSSKFVTCLISLLVNLYNVHKLFERQHTTLASISLKLKQYN